jgi:hypothetical protein
MLLEVILITIPTMALLVAFDVWHCRGRSVDGGHGSSPAADEGTAALTWQSWPVPEEQPSGYVHAHPGSRRPSRGEEARV